MMQKMFKHMWKGNGKIKGEQDPKEIIKNQDNGNEDTSKDLIRDTYSSDVLSMDYVHVQRIPFHQSITSIYKFGAIEALRGNE